MAIRNTSKLPLELHLLNAIAHGSSNAIERDEADGQRQVVATGNMLPSDGLSAIAEKLGIEIIRVDPNDPLFSEVKLPNGWKIIATEHNMWMTLIDRDGRERAKIFYKAAFYDRRAFIFAVE